MADDIRRMLYVSFLPLQCHGATLDSMVGNRRRRLMLHAAPALVPALLAGCASPGPPRPPSLHLPAPVSDLTATRAGDTVVLRFTLPDHTTDGQPLRTATLTGSLCRQLGAGPCTPVDSAETRAPLVLPASTKASAPAPPAAAARATVTWTDPLPLPLQTGAPRLIGYRVQLCNAAGRSAGPSETAYAAAGATPPPVQGLSATGIRQGVALRWVAVPAAGEVLFQRQPALAAAPAAAGAKKTHTAASVWFQADPGNRDAAGTLDATAQPGTPYTYTAVRRTVVQLGGRTLELRSAPSAPVAFTWRDVYPPAAPTSLTALGYSLPATPGHAASYAVDLIWQPVLDARLAGYAVYRQTLDAAGQPVGERTRLTPQPTPTPGFHDATAQAQARYRYSVTALDPAGNESPPAQAVVEPQPAEP